MNFIINENENNVATIEDFHRFIHELLISDGYYKIEIVDSNGKVYRKLYNAGNSLTQMVLYNMNKCLKVKLYELEQSNKEKKANKIINRIFNINPKEEEQYIEFNIWIIDYKTKTHINSKLKRKVTTKVPYMLYKQIILQVDNFINQQTMNKDSIMYLGNELCYHNHVSRAIDNIESRLIFNDYCKHVNRKTIRTYIGKELKNSVGVISGVSMHDISTNTIKGNSKWIGILKNRWE